MKKFLAVVALVLCSMWATAQVSVNDYPVKVNRVETNNFLSNWFVGVEGGEQVSFTDAFQWDTYSPSVSVEFGKWFTPSYGFQLQANAGHYSVVNGEHPLGGSLFVDGMVNLNNLLAGYKEGRVWNLVPYVGFGRVASDYDYKNFGHWGVNAGLKNAFRVSNHLLVDLDLYARRYNGYSAISTPDDGAVLYSFDATQPRNWNLGAQIGLVVELGNNKWNKPVCAEGVYALNKAQYDALMEALSNEKDKNAALEAELAKKPKEVVKENVVIKNNVSSYSVFFASGSAVMKSKEDILNLKSIAELAKANNDLVISVDGYADSATGSSEFNKFLADRRAEIVAAKLIELGVEEKQLKVAGHGGVNDENPTNLNRRVVVSIL